VTSEVCEGAFSQSAAHERVINIIPPQSLLQQHTHTQRASNTISGDYIHALQMAFSKLLSHFWHALRP